MWAVEGLTHRYPTKVLAELLPTCPQYCGHCTRMDLVGNSTPQVAKLKFALKPVDRLDAMIDYLHRTPGVRDVVVSGGDVANMPWPRLESFVCRLMEVESIRDIRLATKALMGLPQHWLTAEVRRRHGPAGRHAPASRGVSLAIHTHVNAAQQVTPLVAEAPAAMLEAGVRDVRNQGVLLRGVNDSPAAPARPVLRAARRGRIMPYYFYLCDMIPGSEHWRLAVWQAQELQHAIMGYLPGFATPRLVCDVPYVGEALGAPGRRVRPRARHLVLDEELHHRARPVRPGRADPQVRVPGPDPDAAAGGAGVVAGAGPRAGADRPGLTALYPGESAWQAG